MRILSTGKLIKMDYSDFKQLPNKENLYFKRISKYGISDWIAKMADVPNPILFGFESNDVYIKLADGNEYNLAELFVFDIEHSFDQNGRLVYRSLVTPNIYLEIPHCNSRVGNMFKGHINHGVVFHKQTFWDVDDKYWRLINPADLGIKLNHRIVERKKIIKKEERRNSLVNKMVKDPFK
jgi:hypothetical protein